MRSNVDMVSPDVAGLSANDRAKVGAAIEAGDQAALLLALRAVAEASGGMSMIAAKTG